MPKPAPAARTNYSPSLPLYMKGVTEADRQRLPLGRDGVVIDCDEDFEHSRELLPDEVAQQRMKNWRTRMEAHLSIQNFRDSMALSRRNVLPRVVSNT